jgi:transcriptional regulator with XRE-family HTH domain
MMSSDNDKPKKDIGKRIQDIRTALDLKQEQLANRLGCSRSNLSQVENGLILPGFTILAALRKKFNVSVDWLLTGEGSMFIHEKEKELYLLDFGKDTDEIKEMLEEMKESPVLKYRMLSDFFARVGEVRFKRRNKEKNKEKK